MAEPIITKGGADTWVNSTKTSANYGDTNAVHVKSGERRGLVRPPLPNILGRTVTSATLYGHAAVALVAQEFSLAPATEHWTQGRATWTNQPAVDAGAYVYTTIGALDAGSLVAFNVTAHLQAIADGTADYNGWRLGTNSTTAGQRFYSTQSGEPAWELHVSLAVDADEPANLRPDGGGAVGTAEPMLAWEFDDQQAFRVQVDTPVLDVDPDEVTPDHDSGWVTSAAPEYDLAAVVYTPPAGTAPTFWRVQVRDTDGNESEWTPWAEFTVAALPSLVIDSPTGTVGDPRVTVAAHLTSGTLASWEVWATGPDRSDVRWRSGVQEGALSITTPAKYDGRRVFTEDEGGWLYVRANDDVERATAVGEQTYTDAWVAVTFAANGALVAPTGLSVSQSLDGDPRLVWQFGVTDVPDAINLMVDGVTVRTIDAADLPTPSAGRYTITDGGEVAPLRPHTLGVAAVWEGEASTPAEITMWSHEVKGVWLIPDAKVDGATIEPVWLAGTAVSGFARGDRTATYTPVKGVPVDITYDWEGYSGTFEGTVDTRHEDVWAALDRIEKLRTSQVRTARLVWASQSIAVRVRDIHATPTENILPSNLEHVVRFGFVEVD